VKTPSTCQGLKEVIMENSKMRFILIGFSQDVEFRVFEFEGISVDRERASFTVAIDVALARKYGIRLQELPLLCRGVLDQCCDGDDKRAFTYGEAEMCDHAYTLAARAEAAKQNKAPRRSVTDHTNHIVPPWRVPSR
jgi:hypothetical protein